MTIRSLLMVALLLTTGCARVATFTVTHPALLNASAVGNSMTVGAFESVNPYAAEAIRSDLARRIASSLNRSIQLLPAGGGVVIAGRILADGYSEQITVEHRQCSRQVPTYRNSQGVTQYRTDYYPCPDYVRTGQAVSQVQFQIQVPSSSTLMFDRVYEHHDTRSTRSQYGNPPPIDGNALLASQRAVNVNEFAKVILPWQERVEVRFEDCDGDDHCRDGFEAVRRGDLAGGEAQFTQVIGPYVAPAAAVPPNMAERIGEAFYNRGVTRGYLGHYAPAVADLVRAIALRPNERERWAEQLEDIQALARDEEALRQQGAMGQQSQNVQQAGTP